MVAVAAENITVTQDLYPQQFAFLHDHRRYPAFIGGRNSGKTFTGAYKSFEWASRRDGLGLIAGPSFPAMKLGPKPRFLKVLDNAGISYQENKNENTLYIPGLNAGIQFAGLENDTYIRGPNYNWGWVDELDFVADPEKWKTAKAAVRVGSDYQLFCTSTPKGQRIIYQEWVLNTDDFHNLHKATSYDNIFVDAEDYVAGLGYQGSFYEQEINAEFVKLEGLVYPGFDRMRQIREVDCADWPAALGMDFGFRTPTVLLTLRHTGERFHIERECYRRGMDATEINAAVHAELDRTGASFLVPDVNAGQIVEQLRREGVRIREPKKAVRDGISQVASILPNLTIDPSCIHTIAEFESYQYPEGGTAERDDPIKANDHAMDALRYLAMELTKPKKTARVW